MPFNLSDLNRYNSELLKLLTESLPDMLWVKDINGRYIYANRAICDGLLMAEDTIEPIGKNDLYFALREREAHADRQDWHTFGELCFNSDQVVIDTHKAMRFEEFGNVKGKLLYLEVYKAPFYDRDGNVIGTVGTGRDITELKRIQLDLENSLKELDKQKERFEYQATHDALTGLPNRILLLDRLQQSINMAQRTESRVAVLFIDLDHFKKINDSLGHTVGDKILIEISRRMGSKIRNSDTLSRLGGDEFCLILNGIKHIDDVAKVVAEGMHVVKEAFTVGNNMLYLGMSVGIAVYPNDGDNPNTLLKNADAAMYKSKEDGRNTYSFYDEKMSEKALDRLFMENALREALDRDEFLVYFQPQIDARKKKIIGMEALVRWQHPTMGTLMPSKFIPLAEETGMIVQLDRLMMQKAVSQFSAWHKEGLEPGRLSMNLAIRQIEEGDFMEFVLALLDNKKCLANHIEFEVTENQIMRDPDQSIEILEKINALGIELSVDDFGTGYSSLAYLKKLPIHKLKIDQSFIRDLPHDAEDAAISRAIISLGKSLNLDVIAEGVETQEQITFLLENGCDNIQGYFYAEAMPAEKMRHFLLKYNEDSFPL
jgi:diguanylate cyclase (GGDEF)-like protein/PAS domain S-box-containing protein